MTLEISIGELSDSGTTGEIFVALQLFKKFKQPYSVFVELINRAIDYSSSQMSLDKNIIATMDEDQLTTLLLSPLKTMSFDAKHEANVGGHCDISIDGGREMLWLGEAKIFNQYDLVLKGFQQLVERYSTGLKDQDQGALVIYMRNSNAKGMIDSWKDYLLQYDATAKVSHDPVKPLEFVSVSIHVGSGLPVTVRHMPIVLYHKPSDPKPRPKRVLKGSASPKAKTGIK